VNTSLPASEPAPRRGRRIFTPEQIAIHVAALRQSGMSVAAYARQEGLSYYSLRAWLQRAKRATRARAPRLGFQSMPLNSLLGQAWAAEVVGPTGVTVRLSAQVPPALVLQLIGLTSRPC
jgi:transposase-like protein